MITFFIEGEPPRTTLQTKTAKCVGGKPVFFESANLREARDWIENMILAYAPDRPIENPAHVDISWYFQKKGQKEDYIWKTTRPDLDNMAKLVLDCMTEVGFWNDDAQVTQLTLSKHWVREEPGILISVVEC